eukprot:6425996-Amphidinium_carterae.3
MSCARGMNVDRSFEMSGASGPVLKFQKTLFSKDFQTHDSHFRVCPARHVHSQATLVSGFEHVYLDMVNSLSLMLRASMQQIFIVVSHLTKIAQAKTHHNWAK